MKNIRITYLMFFGLILGLWGCIEEIGIDTELNAQVNVDEVLVVEATLTDELKPQLVTLSRAVSFLNDSIISFDETEPALSLLPREEVNEKPVLYERGANVRVRDDQGTEIRFIEGEPGRYFSETAFAAETGRDYQLLISTANGEILQSNPESYNGESTLNNIYAERGRNEFDEEGVFIYVDGADLAGQSEYFRYNYEETYKIIAPLWTAVEFKLTNYDPCALPVITYDLDVVPREQEERVCYNTRASEDVILNSTENLDGNAVERFPVRFISKEDFIITHRYSILVRQFVQNIDAYSFYQQLDEFAKSESVFAQVQPGLLESNITFEDGRQTPVLGYFSVASVSEQRLFFDFEDFFDGEPKPAYIVNCNLQSSPEAHVSFCSPGLTGRSCPPSVVERVDIDVISYIDQNNGGFEAVCPGPYIFVDRICGDCTILGSNEVPDFWIED